MNTCPWDIGYEYAGQSDVLPSIEELIDDWGLAPRQAMLFRFGFLSRQHLFPPGFRERAQWVYRVPDPALDLLVYTVNFHAVATYEDGTLILDIETPADLTRH